MVVLQIVAPAEFGGLERVAHALAQGLHGAGHEVHVATVLDRPGEHPFLTPLAQIGITTHQLVFPGRAYWRERRAIEGLCRRLRPDIVHTHGYRPDVVDAGVARRLGIPVVTTVHGFTGGGWKNRCYEWLQRRAFRQCDAVVAVSRPLMERLARAGVPRARLHEVPNAWYPTAPPLDRTAARLVLGLPRDAFVIGWVGRLTSEKGPDVLLDAVRCVSDLPLVVSVVGSGAEGSALQARARSLRLNKVFWHGTLGDAARLFPAFDTFVLSSRTEGTPIVLFEAMASEVPVVATRVGGVPDILSAAEAALVSPNDPVALAAEVRAIYRDPAPARDRARRARARLERDFSLGPWLARYERIYEQVARAAPAALVG